MKRCTHASVRRMASRSPKALSRDMHLLAESGGILIERSGGLQWLLITYALMIVILWALGRRLFSEDTGAIIERTGEGLYQEAEVAE
jgi:hypothetical protein